MDEDEQRARSRVGSWLKGHWYIDALIGIGGMAAVYSATPRSGAARVAVKILHDDVAVSKELRARFEQEARAVASLGHPATVQVSHVDVTDEGAPFMVMELLEGESLGQRAHRGPLDAAEVLAHVEVALDVLVEAHAAGMVHRDIKPDNLFVTSDGRLKVLDFGIARMRQGPSSVRTRTGALLGTTAYMAPEQIHGLSDIDGRVDIFALGSTMFRLLTCRRIHEAETDAALLIKMGTTPAPPVSSLTPALDPNVALIVDRALAFERGRRYPDARAMLEDVRAARRGEAPPHSSAALAVERGAPASGPGSRPAVAAEVPSQRVVVPVSVRSPHAAESSALGGAKTLLGAPAIGGAAHAPHTPTAPGVVGAASEPSAASSSRAPLIAAVLIGAATLALGVGVTWFVLSRGEPAASKRIVEDDEPSPALRGELPARASSQPSGSVASSAQLASGALSERHGELVLSWRVTPEGDVSADVSGAAPEAKLDDATLTVRPLGAGADARSVPLSAAGTHLGAQVGPLSPGLTELVYAFEVGGARVRGVLQLPKGGTAALAASAERTAARGGERWSRGPNGGVLQPLGDRLVEIVACRGSGDVRVYLLDDKLHVKKLKRERFELAVADTWTDYVRLAPHASKKFSYHRLQRSDDPAKLTVLLEDGERVEVALVGLRPKESVDVTAGSHRAPIFADCDGNGEVRGLAPIGGDRDDDKKHPDDDKKHADDKKPEPGKGKGKPKKKGKGRGDD